MKLKLDVSCYLPEVYTKFQVHISKHVEPENPPSHDENQYSSIHLLCKCVYQIWMLYILAEAINEEVTFDPFFTVK